MIQVDKLEHIAVSMAVSVLSPLLAIIVAVGKEVYDHYCRGGFDVKDLMADAVGIIIGSIIHFVI